ncbi:MAG TPA: SsrA-binding protein SmpB [Phaeodactylibacter sp.]|nr:SsrA-binding protein SmpB [Phaeodactylibacter sp.]
MSKKKKKEYAIEIVNKRAAFEFHFIETFEAGIMLTGTEVKSVRRSQVSLKDAYCIFQGEELYVKNLYIKEYEFATHYNHEPRRMRKLLLKRGELKKLHRRVKERGFTIVPYRMYVNERGLVKLEIALAQGKKVYDKREALREKDQKRDLERMKKWK